MVRVPMPEWFLDLDGNKAGPYTAEQIETFLSEGEILSRHRVFSTRMGSNTVTVGEFVGALQIQRAQASSRPIHRDHFTPPPRPAEDATSLRIQRPTAAELNEPIEELSRDPAEDLFEALQALRDRNVQNKPLEMPTENWGSSAQPHFRIGRSAWLMAAAVSIGCTVVWGLLKVEHSVPVSSNSQPPGHGISAVGVAPLNAAVAPNRPATAALPVAHPNPFGGQTPPGTRPAFGAAPFRKPPVTQPTIVHNAPSNPTSERMMVHGSNVRDEHVDDRNAQQDPPRGAAHDEPSDDFKRTETHGDEHTPGVAENPPENPVDPDSQINGLKHPNPVVPDDRAPANEEPPNNTPQQ